MRCREVKLTKPQKNDASKNNAEWVLEVDQEGVRKARFWHTVSHDPGAAGMMHAAFNAFGLTLDSEEDEFVGEYCLADVIVRTQEQGKNAGKEVNDINALLPLTGAVAAGNGQTATPPADPWT